MATIVFTKVSGGSQVAVTPWLTQLIANYPVRFTYTSATSLDMFVLDKYFITVTTADTVTINGSVYAGLFSDLASNLITSVFPSATTLTDSGIVALTNRADTLVMLGDSYTALHKGGSGSGVTSPSTGFFNWANTRLGKRFNILNYAGIGGETTTQILARFQANVLDVNPGWAFIQGGINDVNGSVSASAIYNNLTQMFDRSIAQGIKVIGMTIPLVPVFGTATLRNVAHEVNANLKKYARTKANFILIDSNILADETTGLLTSTYVKADNTHLNLLGCAYLGDFIFQVLDPIVPKQLDPLPTSANETYDNNTTGGAYTNMLPNGMLTGNVSGLCTGWAPNVVFKTGGASCVLGVDYTQSKVANLDPVNRKFRNFSWQQFTALTSNGDEKRFSFRISPSNGINSRFSVGDWVYAECEYEVDDNIVSLSELHLSLITIGGAAPSSIDMFTNGTVDGAYPANNTVYTIKSGVLRTIPIQYSASITQIYPEFRCRLVSGTFRIGRFAVRKATPVTVGALTIFNY